MRTRYYNTDIKRFINRDIVTGDITNSQSLNRYCYVQGNPLKYIDPFGMSPLETLSNGLHTLLDIIGLFQGVAELADLINAIVYAAEGDYTLAVVSVAAIIPGLGILATGAKYGFKSAKKPFVKIAKKLTNYISNSSIGKKLTKTLTKGANDLADEAVELLSDNVGKNGNKIRNKLKELFSKPKKKAKAVVNKKPSEIAKSWQGHGNYPGVDDYDDIIVNKGTTLYRGEPNGSDYFTTLDAIDSSNRNAKNLFEGLQVRKDPVYGYRNEMQGYFFNNDILGAHGITKANPQYGKGGLPQYFIPNSQKLINNGTLKPTNIIRLTK